MKQKKGVHILPSLFTTGNVFCGFYAFVAVLNEDFYHAAWAIAVGMIFDGLDGDDALLAGYPNVKFFEDASLNSGDCQIKSRFGLLDGRIATKLRKIGEELSGDD